MYGTAVPYVTSRSPLDVFSATYAHSAIQGLKAEGGVERF
jgi:hypothetical protein